MFLKGNLFFWCALTRVSLRSCGQGRRAASYVRNAPTLALARGTPKKSNYLLKLNFYLTTIPIG
ncbi:MAG: hypothetical protein NZ519_06645 [Bacteroidia bacterium]|nr:hypothetical protein [Bacteroidia bacterium]